MITDNYYLKGSVIPSQGGQKVQTAESSPKQWEAHFPNRTINNNNLSFSFHAQNVQRHGPRPKSKTALRKSRGCQD